MRAHTFINTLREKNAKKKEKERKKNAHIIRTKSGRARNQLVGRNKRGMEGKRVKEKERWEGGRERD